MDAGIGGDYFERLYRRLTACAVSRTERDNISRIAEVDETVERAGTDDEEFVDFKNAALLELAFQLYFAA
jgi:hypothetical protein